MGVWEDAPPTPITAGGLFGLYFHCKVVGPGSIHLLLPEPILNVVFIFLNVSMIVGPGFVLIMVVREPCYMYWIHYV